MSYQIVRVSAALQINLHMFLYSRTADQKVYIGLQNGSEYLVELSVPVADLTEDGRELLLT